jgi:hypothetical protein
MKKNFVGKKVVLRYLHLKSKDNLLPMKKLVLSAAFMAMAAFGAKAQVTVTYKVDVTAYLAGGATVGANGFRIGGNFAAQGATNGANAMQDWTPSNEFSAMSDQSNNIWSIAVTYPSASVGQTQLYKFVNNDWGTNEGTDPANTIATGGCGVDDGGGNINRTLVIPATDTEVCFVWDGCSACGAASVKSSVINKLSLSPNPASSSIRLDLSGNGNASASISDLTGRVVKNLSGSVLNSDISIADLNAGMYMVTLTEGNRVSQASLVVTK